ncbi:MAG: threonine--tRNA ligase [Proteobacteria bacterium]|nr:threonine--tRNA ligase [Pseudomonadota bacterium]MBU1688355.1 threonine--tRNA ligase [Pseudomonadota bacterium]
MADYTVSLLGGEKTITVAGGTMLGEILKELASNKARKQALAVKSGSDLFDLTATVESDLVVEIVSAASPEGLNLIRHSCAHLMAHAVVDLFGTETKVAIGPATDDGFYYDFDREAPFVPDDLERIEARMTELAGKALPFVRTTVTIDEARQLFESRQQGYKLELLDGIEAETVNLYQVGDFVDLCRGPHVPNTGFLKTYKLTRLAGAYWRGDEHRPMLQRIYGTAFGDPKELKDYLHKLEEARKRDHRKLGRELELFTMQDQVGPGLILWQPKGALLRKLIEDRWREEHYRHNYELLYTPHIARRDLWKTSGHLDFYSENMYSPIEIDEVSYQLKPMNCPFHIAIYNTRKRSYREFPIRWCELGTVYRYEKTGALHGLMRVRGFTQDDAHIFCRPDQLEEEIFNIIDLNLQILRLFGFEDYDVYLSTRPEKYVGSDEHWVQATEALKMALEKKGLAYEVDPGEGVFYGPKIDIKIKDVLGRSWQCSTIQVDFNLPERFEISYTGDDGQAHQPIMIHRALMGSLERFIGVLIEHYAGAFPVWLAPVQARVMNITDAQLDYVEEVYRELRRQGVRVEKDIRNEKLNYKIREAQVQKVPYMLIIGDQEVASGQVTVRLRDGKNLPPMSVVDFAELVGSQDPEAKD